MHTRDLAALGALVPALVLVFAARLATSPARAAGPPRIPPSPWTAPPQTLQEIAASIAPGIDSGPALRCSPAHDDRPLEAHWSADARMLRLTYGGDHEYGDPDYATRIELEIDRTATSRPEARLRVRTGCCGTTARWWKSIDGSVSLSSPLAGDPVACVVSIEVRERASHRRLERRFRIDRD